MRMACVALVVFVLGSGFGIWTALEGPEHINGPAQSTTEIACQATRSGSSLQRRSSASRSGMLRWAIPWWRNTTANWHIAIDAPGENGS